MDFGASNKSGTCLWCGRKLRPSPYRDDKSRVGYLGMGYFCTLGCGWQFGVATARLGQRLKPASPAKPPEGG